MPLTKEEDFAGGNTSFDFCAFCADSDGNVKSCDEIFEGGVQFFMTQVDGDREMAERVTRKNMSALPYWQDKECECLKGEVASDEEFAEILAKLG